MRYDAFISYSHAADGKLAPALQSALQRFAKPWYRRRALRIFRDQTSLAATPELWPTIQAALDEATHFLLLASPEAAQSRWVRREVAHWLAVKPPGRLFIVLTGGELVWDETRGDFDWEQTTALPNELKGAFSAEPLWVDLRWARGEEQLSLKHPRFLEAVGDLAAPLRGRPKEDLLGEDVRQHQRALRLAGAAITALIVLMVAAVLAAVLAVGQRDTAERNADRAATETARAEAETLRADGEAKVAQSAEQTAEARRGEAEQSRDEARAQARLALSRQLTAQAISDRTGPLDLRLLLATEATKLNSEGVDARGNLLTLLNANPALDRFLHGAEGSEVGALAFSPSGALLAAALRDGSTVLWDVAAGQPIGQPLGAGQGVIQDPLVTFSPDGRTMATAGSDGVILFWDVATRQPVGKPLVVPARWAQGTPLADLAFGPDGRAIYAAGDSLLVWKLTGDTPLPEQFGNDFALHIAVSPDGQTVASDGPTDPTSVVLWDATTRERIGEPLLLDPESLATPETGAYSPVITGVVFSPDGRLLAATDTSGRIVVWDAQTRQRIDDVPSTTTGSGVWDIAFRPDSQALVSAAFSGEIVVWDVAADQMNGVIIGHHDEVRRVAYSPDGTSLVTGGRDGTVVLWDPARWSALGQVMVSDDNFLGAVAISPHSQLLAAGSTAGNVVLWDAKTGQPAGELPRGGSEFIDAVAFSPDGRLLAAGNDHGDLALWDVATRKLVALREDAHARPISDVTFSPDNTLLASGDANGVVGIWDITADQIAGESLIGVGQVQALAFSPDGQLLAAGFGGVGPGSTVVWHVADHSVVADLPGSQVSDVAFSPDGRQLIVAQGNVIFRDTTTYQPIGEPLVLATGAVMSLALSPDGRVLATGGSDGTIQLWDVPSRQPIGQPLTGHVEQVGALAFDPSGALLASRGGGQNTVPLLWQVGLPAWQSIACQIARRNLSRAEWARFLGSEEYRKTCPDLPEQDAEATPIPPVAPAGPLDLGSIVTPESFGQFGGVTDSYTRSLDDEAQAVAETRDEDVATVRSFLESAGWRRQYGIAFASADEASLASGQVAIKLRYELNVTEYETAAGATSAFAYLETEGSDGGTPVPLAIPFGEQAIATHKTGTDSDGIPFEYERLAFRLDNLLAEVEIWGYGTAMEIMPGLVEGTGAGLRERMAQAQFKGGPGLSTRILRLVGDDIAGGLDRDRYFRIAEQDLPTFWESIEGRAPPGGPADAIRQPTDTYQVYAEIGEPPAPVYTTYLYTYPSGEIASGIFAALRDDLIAWATPVAQDPPPTFARTHVSNAVFGDESVTAGQKRWIGEPGVDGSYELYGYVTWARVGAEIVVMFVEAPAQRPLAVMNDLMTVQIACLRENQICEPVPVPEALRAAGPATPVPATAVP